MAQTSNLARRDALLSLLMNTDWPHQLLLKLLDLSFNADLPDISAGSGIDPRPGEGAHLGVAEALPYMAGAFDVALFVRSLSHLPHPVAALRET